MAGQNTARHLKAWSIPAFVLLAVALLAILALSLRDSSESQNPAGEQAPNGPTEVQQPGQIDLRAAERRDAEDQFAAGPADAPVALVVFSDYQCPFCAKWSHETLPLMREYVDDGELRIEWRDTNVFGQDSERAALATYAAAQQESFWQYHDALFAGGQHRKAANLSEASLVELAQELGMDGQQFAKDMNSAQAEEEITRNAQLGLNLGATSTPVFLLDGKPLVGAQPSEVFVDALEQALAGKGR